ncbi:hypothetical protein A176_004252 [Myxococcus hansupus]|uniref:Permease n=1 Tax=Pseudomyxococcus hansupus TaxID=1297742 RepID=A0A0H4X153_9BACT|nr:ABC transporter permease [Myxococcus hansupus]AKQ67340.1 hypothetical protein A176_004252 [Myxococcus hansupus]
MDSLRQDLRYAIRTLSRTPGFTLAAGLTLALVIGANTVLFSAIHAMVLRPLPFPAAETLVRIWCEQESVSHASVAPPELLGWREHAQGFSQLAGFGRTNLNRTGTEAPERVRANRVTTNFFSVLGVRPAQGRDFREEDAPSGGDVSVVLVGHGYWQRALGGAPDVVGRTLVLNDRSHTVVGVLPEDFSFPETAEDTDVWIPEWLDPQRHGNHYLSVLGRVAPGTTVEAAQADLKRVAEIVGTPEAGQKRHGIRLTAWQDHLTSNTRDVLWMLWAAVGFVLLIACANVANLMLVRTLSRQRDGAIRAALGASRRRRLQQSLVESVLLSLLGGVMGLVLGLWGMELVRTLLPHALLRVAPLEINFTVLGFSALLSVGTGLLFGLAPALHATGMDVLPMLRQSGSAVGARTGHPLRSGLVMVQLALALVLTVGTGLIVRSLYNVMAVDPGFDASGAVSAQLTLSPDSYRDDARKRAFVQDVAERMKARPGVEAVGFVNDAPLGGSGTDGDFQLEGDTNPSGERRHTAFRVATPDYFAALRIQVRQGRDFGPQDSEKGAPVIIVNEAFVRKYLGGGEALGRRVRLDWDDHQPFRDIVGVVEDVRHESLTRPAAPEAYLPYAQYPLHGLTLVMRGEDSASSALAALREAVKAVDAEQPLYALQPFSERVERVLLRPTGTARLLGAFAALAVLLAGVGVYGVLAYSVGQRTRELGIRLALGAHPLQVLRLVLGQGLRLTALGVGAGLLAALGCTRLMAATLYGVEPFAPDIFLGVAVALGGLSLLACLVPALRASRVSPSVSLRAE